MWLFNSSIGKKFVMALSGFVLVFFVTFHVLMNAVAICWPTAYNQVCLFLGANWYALILSAGLGAIVVLHIIYALVLTIQNRKARGTNRYEINARPKSVEWSSKNMLVLGIVVLCFLGVHLVQFWAKMQAQEAMGTLYTVDGVMVPPAAGTLFLQLAFSEIWTPIVYIIGFVALWFHMNHGFWSMWQSVGWNNDTWLPRLKAIACWWVSIVIGLFIIQACVFTWRANENYYVENPALMEQYMEMYQEQSEHINADLQEELMTLGQKYEALQKSTEINEFEKGPQLMEIRNQAQEIQQKMQENQTKVYDSFSNLSNLGKK